MIIDLLKRRRQPDVSMLFGHPLAELEKTDLFSWFAFIECASELSPPAVRNGQLVMYRPEGVAVHDDVLLVTELRGKGIERLDLCFQPAMSTAAQFPFTLDCAKSFLAAALPERYENGQIGKLIMTLGAMMAARSLNVCTSPAGDSEESDRQVLQAVKVITGLADECLLEEVNLRFAFSSRTGEPPGDRYALRITIARTDQRLNA